MGVAIVLGSSGLLWPKCPEVVGIICPPEVAAVGGGAAAAVGAGDPQASPSEAGSPPGLMEAGNRG